MCKTCGCHGTRLVKKLLTVEGMSCGHCKDVVEKTARGLPGVMAGEVNLETKTLTIEFDPAKTGLKDVTDAIENAGFSVID